MGKAHEKKKYIYTKDCKSNSEDFVFSALPTCLCA